MPPLISAPGLGMTAPQISRAKQDEAETVNRVIRYSLAAAAIAVFSVPAFAQNQQSEGPAETVKATHGDWEVVCLTQKPEECRMRQIGTLADGKRVMVVHIGKLKDAKTPDGQAIPAAIRITTPLGTLLREGLRLQIDSGQETTGAFNICIPSGCIVSEPISDQFLSQLKAGNVAKMSFNVLQQGAINVSISLKGFTKAYDSL